ncbi:MULTISPECIES: hypothetical protein [unclassified Algoriphagus]|uniref:hypothetical protein n=3 Tax=Algoriphagus TaxID=246875 RepID=UPI00257E629D|nr:MULTISPECIES: hypothetical protein [unclassified Algoriphagus]
MRKLVPLILILFMSLSALAKDAETKTFLVLFKSKELKAHQTSLKAIESQFSSFNTKTYSGNSELALLIEIPSCDFDECFLGDFLVTTGDQDIKLQEIAFRLFDMTESKRNLQLLLSAYQNNPDKKKIAKADKPSNPRP